MKVSYSIGDTVKLVKSGNWPKSYKNRVGIITDVSIDSGVIEYAFNGSAWFYHNQFEFISEATEQTLKEAVKLSMDDEE